MNRIILAMCMLVTSLPAFLGLYLFAKGVRRIQLAIGSTKWPITGGAVVDSETTRDVSTYRRKSSVTFETKTTIRYSVNGKEYNTNVLHFGQSLGSGDKSDAVLQRLRYPAGKEVPVYYDPANPAVGVMKAGLSVEAFWLPGAGLAFLLPAVLCLFLLPRIIISSGAEDQAYANYVQTAIEQRQPNLPPPRQNSDPRDADRRHGIRRGLLLPGSVGDRGRGGPPGPRRCQPELAYSFRHGDSDWRGRTG